MRVLIFGTFDLLHPGHRFVLASAAARGSVYVVIARDRNVRRLKGRPPVQSEEVRLEHVRAAAPDAYVTLGDSEDFLAPLRVLMPDLILLGYDQQLPPGVTAEDLPCPVERLPAFEPDRYKTSLLRDMKT